MKSVKNSILILGITFLLGSCSSSRHYQRNAEITDFLYGNVDTGATNLANESWQNLFSDPVLLNYIGEGLKNNPDLQAAILRVVTAEAYFNQSKAALAPSLSAQAGHTFVHNSESAYPNGPQNFNASQIKLQSSWEIDFWGKLSSAKKAAYAGFLATSAAQKAVQTRLIANIASVYYNLLALDQKLLITRQTVQNNMDLVETLKILKDHGNVTGAAVVQSEATLYATEVTIPDIEQQIRETENTLCLLLGRSPGTIERGDLEEQSTPEMLSIGVPSELLDNRPDVMQAEYELIRAWEMTNNARAYFFPSVTLTANAGLESLKLADLLNPVSFAANVAGGLTQPVFNRRMNKTRLEVTQAQQEEALLYFKNALLNAGAEVIDALGQYNTAEQKIELRANQLEALEKSVDYTQELLKYGSATYIEVLIAQQSLLTAQLNNINDHTQKLSAVVSLYRALGGGWR